MNKVLIHFIEIDGYYNNKSKIKLHSNFNSEIYKKNW